MHGLQNCDASAREASQGSMAGPQFIRARFSSAMLWRTTTGLFVVALLSMTAVAQAVSVASLNDGSLINPVPANSASANSSPVGGAAASPVVLSASPVVALASPVTASALPEAPSRHKFWDNENRFLFATVAALSAADFAITRSILQNGGKELDPVTRLFSGSTAGLAMNFAGETAGIIGISYYLHKTGHHKLERLTPMLNIAGSSFAVVYDLNHR